MYLRYISTDYISNIIRLLLIDEGGGVPLLATKLPMAAPASVDPDFKLSGSPLSSRIASIEPLLMGSGFAYWPITLGHLLGQIWLTPLANSIRHCTRGLDQRIGSWECVTL